MSLEARELRRLARVAPPPVHTFTVPNMQLRLFTASALLVAAAMVSCTDHSSTVAPAPQENPDPPVNGGDGDVFVPPITAIDPSDPLDGDPDTGSTGGGGSSGDNNGGGGIGDNGGGGGGGGSGQSSGGGSGGGGAPGAAVPEPGTMLLVGSGLASLAYYPRRQRRAEPQRDSDC